MITIQYLQSAELFLFNAGVYFLALFPENQPPVSESFGPVSTSS